jgi:hypothetical protein
MFGTFKGRKKYQIIVLMKIVSIKPRAQIVTVT